MGGNSSFVGAGFWGGLSDGLMRGRAAARQKQEYEQRKELLAQKKKQLEIKQKYMDQIRETDPELYKRLVLGFGEKKPKDEIYEVLLGLLRGEQPGGAPPGQEPPPLLKRPPEAGGGLPDMAAGLQNKFVRAFASKELGLPRPQVTNVRGLVGEGGGPVTRVQETDPLFGTTKTLSELPEHQKPPGRDQFVPPAVATELDISPATTMAELRKKPGLRLKTPEEKRLAAPVSPATLKLYADADGNPPRGAWKEGPFEEAINNGVYSLKIEQKAGEAEKKIALGVPVALSALNRVNAALFPEGGEFRGDLLRSIAFVPKDPTSLVWKTTNWLGMFPEAGPLSEDMHAALEPFQRLMSGGAIGKVEGPRFLANALPSPADMKRPEVARQKIADLYEVLADLAEINDPFSAKGKARVKSILRRADAARGSVDATTPSRVVLESAHQFLSKNPDKQLVRDGTVLTLESVKQMLGKE